MIRYQNIWSSVHVPVFASSRRKVLRFVRLVKFKAALLDGARLAGPLNVTRRLWFVGLANEA